MYYLSFSFELLGVIHTSVMMTCFVLPCFELFVNLFYLYLLIRKQVEHKDNFY